MSSNPTATPSPRWDEPERSADGSYWRARLAVQRLSAREQSAGLEPAVFGPTRDACLRETVRQDQIWAAIPERAGDREETRERQRFLAGPPDGTAPRRWVASNSGPDFLADGGAE